MSKKLLALLIAAAMISSFAACGAKPETEGGDSAVSDTNVSTSAESTSSADAEESAPAAEESKVEDVSEEEKPAEEAAAGDIVINTESLGDFDEKLADIADSYGVEVHLDEDDAEYEDKIAFTTSKKTAAKIAEEYAEWLEGFGASGEDSNIKEIDISDSYDAIEFRLSGDLEGLEALGDSLLMIMYFQPMSELQMLTGVAEDDVSYNQKVINLETNEVISEGTMPDDINK